MKEHRIAEIPIRRREAGEITQAALAPASDKGTDSQHAKLGLKPGGIAGIRANSTSIHQRELQILPRQLNCGQICPSLDEKGVTKREAYPLWIW